MTRRRKMLIAAKYYRKKNAHFARKIHKLSSQLDKLSKSLRAL